MSIFNKHLPTPYLQTRYQTSDISDILYIPRVSLYEVVEERGVFVLFRGCVL